MAKLQLTLYNIDSYEINGEKYQSKEDKTVSLSTEKVGVVLYLRSKANTDSIKDYTLNLVECTFQKKMYQPTEILADLQINKASGETWISINRSIIESTFKHKQVKLEADSYSIGDDFYVHEVLPCYKKESMVVKLKIYSLDKLLTLDKSCYSYVAKKLVSDIIKPKIADYKKPYNKGESLKCSEYGSCSHDENTKIIKDTHLQVLRYVTKEEKKGVTNVFGIPQRDKNGKYLTETVYTYVEHIFPYLVQYNESFYDMLIRTCNRWGEFVFWEGGKLNIGYNSEAAVIEVGDYTTITYPQQDSNESLLPSNADQHYFPVGADDDTIRDTNAQKSKWSVKGKIGSLNGMEDVYGVQKFSQFFGTDKDPVTFGVTQVIDDLVDWGIEEAAVSDRNSDYNDKYFPKEGTTDEQYGQASFMMPDGSTEEKDALNEFTEIDTKYKDAKYLEILGYEQKALNNVVVIDYDTVWPKLKLGNIIHVDGEEFIVTDISSKMNAEGNQVFWVEGIGKVADKFYPAMLPSGHVRYSGPQKAKIEEGSTDDPCDQNRVRVAFPWQLLPKENLSDPDQWIGDLSPRIRIASSDGGANMASRFYKNDYVFIGYVDGNIERPYVLGSVPNMGTIMNNVHSMTTPGGHALNLTDGTGQGLTKFLTSTLSPVVNTAMSFWPSSASELLKMDSLSDKKYNKYFEGGFTLTDRYGLYRISGSTENRSVSIMSPWGNVMINAFTGIQILAPNGDIKIVGKNVDIAAGNKLTLTSGTNIMNKLKGKNKSEMTLDCLKNLPAAVADKMSQKLLKVFDLKLVRSAVEIVMRPVEGTLTLKSMRFMKLEAGMRNQCGFPDYAYKIDKRNDLKQKIEEAISVMNATNAFGTTDIIKAIGGFVDQLATDYHDRSDKLVKQKQAFEREITYLAEYANDPDAAFCSNYTDLQATFWDQGEYQEWTEDKLGFVDNNVGIEPTEGGKYKPKVNQRLWNGFTTEKYQEWKAKFVCDIRANSRKTILDQANKLRKMICETLNYEVSKSFVKKYFKSVERIEIAPAGYIDKILSSVKKEKIPNSVLFSYPADKRTLAVDDTMTEIGKKYLKRAISYYLLKELGFDMSYLQNIDATLIDADSDASLMKDSTWNNLITGLSSMPIVGKDKSGALQQAGKALKSVQRDTGWADLMAIRDRFKDINIWGDGKEGRILIGADGKTFEFKDNTGFQKVETLETTGKTFKQDSENISESAQHAIMQFALAIKIELARF